MRVLLRLAEDVVILETLPAQRRRDIVDALNSSLSDIVPFLVKTLETSVANYKEVSVSNYTIL